MTDDKMKIAIVLLAAGGSSRMGDRVKQVLPWKNTTLLGNAYQQAKASIADDIYVVIGAYPEIIKANISFEASEIIENTDWKNGLGSSIASAMNHFLNTSFNYNAVLIMLADQPYMDTNYLNKMIGNWKGNPTKIITTQYEHRSGVPAIFGKEYFSELQNLNKDFGAKDIIANYNDAILALNPKGKEIDIDSWETYQELLKKKS